MAISAVITLTTAGADTGPFNLYSDIDGFVTPFETGVSKPTLEAGYLSTLIPDGSVTVRVKSTSLFCKNYIDLSIASITTTTSTTATPPEDLVIVSFNARHDPASSVFPSLKFAYSTNGGTTWTAFGTAFTDTTCANRAVISVQRNSNLAVRITTEGNTSIQWQSARSAVSPCPAFSGVACSWPASTNLNSRTYYFTVNADNQGTC
jgi:hypothetical protein